MKEFFGQEGPVISWLLKIGKLIILTVLWIICCIPIVTIASSSASYYYAVVKTVRHDVGYPVGEFWKSFKRTLKDGILFSLIFVIWVWLLYVNLRYTKQHPGITSYFLNLIYYCLIVLSAGFMVYLFAVLSRFAVSKGKMLKMALVLTFKYLLFTLAIVAGSAVLVWLMLYKIPIVCIVIIPGIWCYLVSYMIEKAMKSYMPPPEKGKEAWYDE